MSHGSLFQFIDFDSAFDRQERLAGLVVAKTPQGFLPRLLCGLDAAYHDDWGVGAAAVWDTAESRIVETFHVLGNVSVSYTPGLLGFREGPLILKAEKGLKAKPDAYLVDGHGIAHPRRFGLACHVGLAVGKPTIGVAKSGLFGSVEGNGVIGFGGEMLGVCLKTSTGRRYYVSVGHLIGLDDAVGIVSECMVGGFPAPLRAAHLESVRLRGLRR